MDVGRPVVVEQARAGHGDVGRATGDVNGGRRLGPGGVGRPVEELVDGDVLGVVDEQRVAGRSLRDIEVLEVDVARVLQVDRVGRSLLRTGLDDLDRRIEIGCARQGARLECDRRLRCALCGGEREARVGTRGDQHCVAGYDCVGCGLQGAERHRVRSAPVAVSEQPDPDALLTWSAGPDGVGRAVLAMAAAAAVGTANWRPPAVRIALAFGPPLLEVDDDGDTCADALNVVAAAGMKETAAGADVCSVTVDAPGTGTEVATADADVRSVAADTPATADATSIAASAMAVPVGELAVLRDLLTLLEMAATPPIGSVRRSGTPPSNEKSS